MNRYKFDSENHIHLLDGKPLMGTSSVTSVLAKTLTWWASGKAMEVMGWVNSKTNGRVTPKEVRLASAEKMLNILKEMTPEDYISLTDRAYRAHKESLDDSATAGTDLHALLERWVKLQMGIAKLEEGDDLSHIEDFIEWCDAKVEKFLWSEVHTYNEELWVGGISDLGVKLKDGRYGIVDFKSAKEVYDSHYIQIAGYALQLEATGGLDSEGNKLFDLEHPIDFFAVVPFGSKNKTPKITEDVAGYKEDFKNALALYKRSLRNKRSS